MQQKDRWTLSSDQNFSKTEPFTKSCLQKGLISKATQVKFFFFLGAISCSSWFPLSPPTTQYFLPCISLLANPLSFSILIPTQRSLPTTVVPCASSRYLLTKSGCHFPEIQKLPLQLRVSWQAWEIVYLLAGRNGGCLRSLVISQTYHGVVPDQ